MYGYDDDMSLHNYSKEKDSSFQIIKAVLNRTDKYIGNMKIKKCENKPILTKKTDKVKIQKFLIEWYDDRIIPSQRSKIKKKILKVFNEIKRGKYNKNTYLNLLEKIKKNKSEFSKNIHIKLNMFKK